MANGNNDQVSHGNIAGIAGTAGCLFEHIVSILRLIDQTGPTSPAKR
jgi:hypothetical protein